MPVLLPLNYHLQPAVVRYTLDQSPSAQGSEGQAIYARIREIQRDLHERSASELEVRNGGQVAYRHVPFQTVGTLRVRYKSAVALQPRQFDFDDEDE